MAIGPVLTSTARLHVGSGARIPRGASQSGVERLGELVRTRKAVAAELDTPGRTHSERTILTARFNDLQRQVNQLDGIVASEGQESAGPTPAPQVADANVPDSAQASGSQASGSQASGSSATTEPTAQRPETSTANTTTTSTEPASSQAAQVDVVA